MTSPPAGRRIKLVGVIILMALAVASIWMASRTPVSPFVDIAYPYLPMDKVTTDPGDFTMVAGHDAPPVQVTRADGTDVYPVFSHPDPAVVPLVGGRTVYFPAHLVGETGLTTPPLPPHNRPLPAELRFGLVQYLPEEARVRLQGCLQGSAP